ncbi:unnamed protein product [Chrysodeixis includens]|uniref:Uncharacterized protein n=1 Tax=Chrysodeixis includens TaxID=689277 RepID=A0A9N8L4P5_CHRIL|nr:unnamed protein product [Chrysodeixis includens]
MRVRASRSTSHLHQHGAAGACNWGSGCRTHCFSSVDVVMDGHDRIRYAVLCYMQRVLGANTAVHAHAACAHAAARAAARRRVIYFESPEHVHRLPIHRSETFRACLWISLTWQTASHLRSGPLRSGPVRSAPVRDVRITALAANNNKTVVVIGESDDQLKSSHCDAISAPGSWLTLALRHEALCPQCPTPRAPRPAPRAPHPAPRHMRVRVLAIHVGMPSRDCACAPNTFPTVQAVTSAGVMYRAVAADLCASSYFRKVPRVLATSTKFGMEYE